MSVRETFLWHDYETFGSASRSWDRPGTVAPYRARPAQFGAIRTTMDLEEIGEPIEVYCKPSFEELPSIDACLTTGMVPSDTLENGLPERRFFEEVLAAFTPHTCGVGWNNFGYDDEVTRFGLWRNCMVPVYDREWRDGRSRWDLLPVFRLVLATHPGAFTWPTRDDGVTSLALEGLAKANGITDHDAHDALGDVRATIALAKRVKEELPDLWTYALSMRDTKRATAVVESADAPLFYSSYRLGGAHNYGTIVQPVSTHQKNCLAVDLRFDPTELLELRAEDIHQRLFNRGEGEERLPIQKIKMNQSPMIAPVGVLKSTEQWTHLELDRVEIEARAETVRQHRRSLGETLAEVYGEMPEANDKDEEERLYGGGFPSDGDVLVLERTRNANTPEAWRRAVHQVQDARLSELAFRCFAREHVEALDDAEKVRWQQHMGDRINETTVRETLKQISERRQAGRDPDVCELVSVWVTKLAEHVGVDKEAL